MKVEGKKTMDFIGIDKTVSGNYEVVEVDINKLFNVGSKKVRIIQSSNSGIQYFDKNRPDNFESIQITDGFRFNTLTIGVKKCGNKKIHYCILDMGIAIVGENNLTPLNIKAYLLKQKETIKYIRELYGVYLKSKNSKFNVMEINSTIELNDNFTEYSRVLKIFQAIAPKTYKTKPSCEDTVYSSNKSIGFKIYGKGKQLNEKHGLNMPNNILRLEYTLKTNEKIKSVLGHNVIDQMKDSEIHNFFKGQFQKDFINSWIKNRDCNRPKLVKLCKKYKKECKQWVKPFLLHIMNKECSRDLLLYDIEDLREVFAIVDNKNKGRYMKSIYKLSTDTISSYVGVNDKITEILTKIHRIEEVKDYE